jgi:hypothetical protein
MIDNIRPAHSSFEEVHLNLLEDDIVVYERTHSASVNIFQAANPRILTRLVP